MGTSEPLRRSVLWTYLAISGFVAIEPSPYELLLPLVVLVFARGGMLFDRTMAPLIVTLTLYDAGGLLALTPFVQEWESVAFIVISLYITATVVIIAAIVAAAPIARMETIRSGYIVAALIAAVLGVIGYFDIAGTGQYFTLYDNSRAMGAFKDPNVFGPFLVPPIVFLVQDVLLRRASPFIAGPKLAVLLLGLFLSFSRGAIIDCVFSAVLLLGLTFLTTDAPAERRRTVLVTIFGAVLVACLIAAVLAIPTVRDLASERASLSEDYDSGEQGRFGNQLRSIPMLLDLPFGFGPLRFGHIFPQDPHEVFISAFASFGWLGGLAFLAFIAITLYYGWALSLRRSRLQPQIIALWSALFPQILQGVQIDTGHWRHLFLMCGCLFGFAAAARREWQAEAAPALPAATAARMA